MLFHRLCEYAGVSSAIVAGYIKDDPAHVGRMGILDHAWNVIKIEDNYYFLDFTWAAGYCTKEKGKLKHFVKKLNDFYWLTPQDKLCIDHYPAEKEWQEKLEIAKDTFRDQPYINHTYIPEIKINSPRSRVLEAAVGDTINFSINYPKEISYIQCNTNIYDPAKPWHIEEWNDAEIKKQRYLKFTHYNNTYTFSYIVDSDRIRYIDLVFDYADIIRYKIKVHKHPVTQNSHNGPGTKLKAP